MKQFSVKRMLTALLCLVVFLLWLPLVNASAYAEASQASATADGADFTSGLIKYQLESPLIVAPDTFEAWIKVEEDAPAVVGNIFSNEILTSVKNTTLSYYINEDGNVCVNWNSSEKNVVFDSFCVKTGAWMQIAVVRSESAGTFTLYVNGTLTQAVACGAGSDMGTFTFAHSIGGDCRSVKNTKHPFMGKIKQVTLYQSALKQSEILRDYNNGNVISANTRSGLLFNVQLHLGDVELNDTSLYRNNAYLASNDYFYEGDLFETQDYTLAVLPDIQMLTNHYQEAIETLPEYLLANYQSKKIQALITTGDLTDGITNGKDWDRQYSKIATELNKIEGAMPYIAIPGNHDYDNECKTDHSVSYFNAAFPISRISGWQSWGGSYADDSVVNAYYLMEFCGVKYLIFALDFGPSDEVLDWCCQITEKYPDRRVIAVTHGYLGSNGKILAAGDDDAPTQYGWSSNSQITVNDPSDMWDKWLKKYSNVFMTISGHVFGDDILVREYVGENGNIVSSFLLNAQGILMNDGLELMLGLFSFDELNQNIYVNYYSTIQDKLYNFQNQFVYSFAGNTTLLSTEYYPASNTVSQVTTGYTAESALTPSRKQILTEAAQSSGVFVTLTAEEVATAEKPYIGIAVICAGFAVVTGGVVFLRRRKK
jgi:hypothetical protein